MVAPRSVYGFAVVALLASLATAQQTGSIRGIVTDLDFDAALSGARVQVINSGVVVTTDDFGSFSVPDLPPDAYTIVVAKQGYVRSVVRAQVRAGAVAEVRVEMLGELTELEEWVVEEQIQESITDEQGLLDQRFDSAALIDSIGQDQMSRAGASDAAGALRLVAGASTQDGSSAVIRGLPDRYVASLVNGVLLPSSDEDKRSVPLDQFRSGSVENVQVFKTFTPDQQGNASGGAVNVQLRSVPDKPFFVNWKVGTSYNSQATGREDFLSYAGGGLGTLGESPSGRRVQEEGANWEGAVGASTAEAPDNFSWTGSTGGSFDIGDGWRAGGFVNLFYNRSAEFRENERDESRQIGQIGNLMTPQTNNGTIQQPPFFTSLLSIDRSRQELQWGGLATVGVQSEDHAFNLTYMLSKIFQDNVVVAEDTEGKGFFFPGHDPQDPTSPGFGNSDEAAFTRQQTLAYIERETEALQLSGRHRWDVYGFSGVTGIELDWTIARNSALRDTPDRREFASFWNPAGNYGSLKPAAEITLGNLQRTFIRIEEESEELAFNLRVPFEIWGGREGAFKTGYFRDEVERQFRQDTYSNFNDVNDTSPGQFDELRWSDVWMFEDHPISGALVDVDYTGTQTVEAQYVMLDLPIADDLRLVGGVRFESTDISIRSFAEEDATWVPPVTSSGLPNFDPAQFPTTDPTDPAFDEFLLAQANPTRSKNNVLPAIGLTYEFLDGLQFRAAYSETIARQTFKELSPVFQQEYLGGPVFIGDPSLEISDVRNIDFRIDYAPAVGSFFSVSWFRKIIDNPIEYVELSQGFTFTRPINYPRGKLSGWEVEMRQDLGRIWQPLAGLTAGGNSTWIDATVRRPDFEVLQFEQFQGVRPATTRDMTDAPNYLWNLFLTYDVPATGSSFGAFYTVTGDALVQGPGPSNVAFIPATYERDYDNLSVTFQQDLGRGVRLSLSANNLTNAIRQQFYSTEYLAEDVVRREYTTGITYSLSIGGEIRF
ncbi:MAG: TonB-dependent receptor [Planctomycetota bacterium]